MYISSNEPNIPRTNEHNHATEMKHLLAKGITKQFKLSTIFSDTEFV